MTIRPLRLLPHVALLVLGALLSPIALGSAAPARGAKLAKRPAPRALQASELERADRLAKLPPSTAQEKLKTLAALGLAIPVGQLGEPFELSPRRPFIDGATWLGLHYADSYAAKSIAMIVPVLGDAELHLTPVPDRAHLVECYVDMQGHSDWGVLTMVGAKDGPIAESVSIVVGNRVSFVIPAQNAVRPIVASIIAGPMESDITLHLFDLPRFMLRSCLITPVG